MYVEYLKINQNHIP